MFRASCGLLLCFTLWLGASSASAQAQSELDQLKDQADTAYRERDFPKAIELSDKALAIAPADHIALYLRGSSKVELGFFSGMWNRSGRESPIRAKPFAAKARAKPNTIFPISMA